MLAVHVPSISSRSGIFYLLQTKKFCVDIHIYPGYGLSAIGWKRVPVIATIRHVVLLVPSTFTAVCAGNR